MLFSQRKGLRPAQKIAQVDGMDDELRSCLWNVLELHLWSFYQLRDHEYSTQGARIYPLFISYWQSYFKKPIDGIPRSKPAALDVVREYFFNCPWYEVYDFIEFTALNNPREGYRHQFREACNAILERENSAYRFVGGHITQITCETEINSIEEALSSSSFLAGVNTHLSTALEHLSRRENPDYRNSIKESISAIESLAQIITKDSKASLGEALAMIEREQGLHPAFKKSLSALYGYTSDADGIRHAMLEAPDLTFGDAKYMLVSCTAFINFMIEKTARLEIDLSAPKD